MPTEMRDDIRAFIVENFLFGDAEPLSSDSISLLDTGIIDSVGVLELVAHLEGDLGLSVDDEDLIPENLDTIDNLVNFIARKQQP